MSFLQDTYGWIFLSFVIFAIAAYKFGKAPFLAKLDDRIATIRRDIETAQSLRIEAQELLAQYQRRQREAAQEAEAIVANARSHADQIRNQAEVSIREMADRHEAQLKERLQRMEEAAMREIRSHASDLALKATAEIIASQMNADINARLVDQSIEKLPAQFN